MADDHSKRGPQDRSRINVEEDWELRYWSETLGVSQQELMRAVAAVGISVDKVRAHLGKAAARAS